MKLMEYYDKHKKAVFICLFVVFLVSVIFIWLMYSETLANINNPFVRNTKFSTLMLDEDAYGETTFDSSNLNFRTILDKDVENNLDNVIFISFWVGGNKNNDAPEPIYDISLQDLVVDCDLLSPYLKWKLIKNGEEISNGSFDYQFDTIKDGRLVLTSIQQDLPEFNIDKSKYDFYQFYLWLSDSCQEEDITK